MNVGRLIFDSSAFSKSSLYIWKFLVHELLKPSLKDFEQTLPGMWNECNWIVIWTFFGIALPWNWNENWPFPVLWPLLSFPNLLTYWHRTYAASSFRLLSSSAGIPSLLLILLVVMLSKAHLTSYSRMSGSRWDHTIMVTWAIKIFFVQFICVFTGLASPQCLTPKYSIWNSPKILRLVVYVELHHTLPCLMDVCLNSTK